MPRYFLDTNVLTALEDRDKPGFDLVTTRLAGLRDEDEVFLSILTVYEYRHGISKAPMELRESLLKAWKDFEERFLVLGLSFDIFQAIREAHPALQVENWLEPTA
jgi:predicted nucleic acid-binding protein